jgi:hypothetical protein
MNAIGLIKQNHPILRGLEPESLIYVMLVSSVITENNGVLKSKYGKDSLYFHLKAIYTKEDIDNALTSLIDKSLIEVEHFEIVVGMDKVLYSDDKAVSFEEEIANVDAYYNAWVSTAKSIRTKALADNAKDMAISVLHSKNPSTPQVAGFFSAYYALVYQEQYRELMAKEHGQLKLLLKFYSAFDVLKMIIRYINTEEVVVSVSGLFAKKDKYYHLVKDLKKTTVYTDNGF